MSSSWVRRKEGSALIASSLWSRRSPIFWTRQTGLLSEEEKRRLCFNRVKPLTSPKPNLLDQSILAASHSTKTSGLNFWQLPLANETTFSKIPKKRPTSWGIPKFSKKLFKEVFSPFNFAPGISRIRISEIQQLSEFLETFVGNICTICRCFQIFESFGWMASVPCLLTSNRFFECAHPIIDKPMVITEPTVLSARLLGLGSKFFKWWMTICMDWHSTWHFRSLASLSQICFHEREIYYTRELIVIVHPTCPDHLLNSPSSLDTSVSAAWMVSCALSNSIFSCVASWVLNSNLINKNTEIKEKDNWVAVNKNIQVSTTRFFKGLSVSKCMD